jgi:arginase family enzyme
MDPARSMHVDLDGAWPRATLTDAAYLDARDWGPELRYSTTPALMRRFEEFAAASAAPFTLCGSGDFHHLTALWLRRLTAPYTLISFDNHPDWDIRPPRLGCGTWISRALESPLLERAVVWGCGNFELEWPMSLFGNRRGLKAGRLRVRPWEERLKPKTRARWETITPENWRGEFSRFAEGLIGKRIYITVDLDCLRKEEAATNWENGLFTAEDVAWAIGEIARQGEVVAGDVCGAFSPPRYARFIQKMEARLDHPGLAPIDQDVATARNLRALGPIWKALTEGGSAKH